MTVALERGARGEKRKRRGYWQVEWESIAASIAEPTPQQTEACELCGDSARYAGRACADRQAVRLCDRCLNIAIRRLIRIRDDAKLATGLEPLCNRCWRPIIDPATHIDLNSLV
jgi:hypothetical protein